MEKKERSEAQKRADKKYNYKKMHDGTKKQFHVIINTEDYEMIDNYCNEKGISKAKFVVEVCRQYIDNNK